MDFFSSSLPKKFPILNNEIQLERRVVPETFCESVGQKAAILGFEKGVFETWVYPFKIASDLQFTVSIPQFNLFIEGKNIAQRIIVRPEMTSLVFSHDLFTIQWHLLTPINEPGCIFLFDVNTYAPLELWISFVPNLIPMWPAGLGGQYTLWLDELNCYYIGEGSKKYCGIIGSPLAKSMSNIPGHQLPDEAMKLMIPISKELSAESYIPVIVTGSIEGKEKASQRFIHLLNSISQIYENNIKHYQKLRSDFMTIKTPAPQLDQAFEWAKISLDKGMVESPQLGKGMVAGYGASGKTHRPGFAWFFGGDTFLNSLAVNCYGDFETTRQALTILRDNQRPDGKIFHELSQGAGLLNWFEDYPYGFYHAETSAFYIVAMYDYLARSRDESFIQQSWNSIKMAYHYCLTADEDHDGLMENSAAGLAAMEVGEMLKQNRVDIYLASIWLQALQCMIKLSEFFNEKSLNKKCQQQFDKGFQSFLQIFVDEKNKQLNFALLTDGDKHSDQTVWQSIPLFLNLIDSKKVGKTMRQFASPEMCTDWGVRGVSRNSKYYDPISYNNGSVWPFTTGYVATAQYKHHRSINGWQNLMANAKLTLLDALGWHTELLSGEYYRPVSTSVPHQLFSATGIVNPLVMGLLGLEGDAIARQLKFIPHLPMDWDEIQVNSYRCGEKRFDFFLHRSNNKLKLEITSQADKQLKLLFSPAFGLGTTIESVTVNGDNSPFKLQSTPHDVHCEIECVLENKLRIEIKYQLGIEFDIPLPGLQIGSFSEGLKLIDYNLTDNKFTITTVGLSGCEYTIPIKTEYEIKKVDGGKVRKNNDQYWELKVNFDKDATNKFLRKNIYLYLNKPSANQ